MQHYTMLAGLGIVQDVIASQGYADEVRAVRESLTPVKFDAAWNWGRAASLEQALAYALESTGP